MSYTVMLVAAAGSSTRMGRAKQKILLAGEPTLLHTLRALEAAEAVDGIVLILRAEDREELTAMAHRAGLRKLLAVVEGGNSRQQSVQNGLAAIPTEATLVGIHDGARPLASPQLINAVVRAAEESGAAAAAVPVQDTLKRSDETGRVTGTVDRTALWRVQTPQVFQREIYARALQQAKADNRDYTDDCQLLEAAGFPVRLVAGEETNLKLTTPADIELAEAILQQRKREEGYMRIGHGYDVHRLVEGRPLILGGVTIPFEKGLLGHSDADVLAHAIMDALLGAAGLGDIGALFPDTDPAFAGADSLLLLEQVAERVRAAGLVPANIDATVLAQKPKLRPYIDEMRRRLAAACGIAEGAVGLKATTEEGLGFTGALEGIAAHAVCLLMPR